MPDRSSIPDSTSAMFLPLGISAATGFPISVSGNLEDFRYTDQRRSEAERRAARRGLVETTLRYGMTAEAGDVNCLSDSGWGVLLSAGADKYVLDALGPLLRHRKEQAGALFAVFEGSNGYQPNDTAEKWIVDRGLDFGPVNPRRGVPFYILIVGSPNEIPFEFQYSLDLYWGVGRLHFESSDDYRVYAESVVAYENKQVQPRSRQIALFATQHDFDDATQLFVKEVAAPLADPLSPYGSVGSGQNYLMRSFIGDVASKQQLAEILIGNIQNGPPAVLFTGSHGMGFTVGDLRQRATQGALVCSDWGGFGTITDENWFSAADLPQNANVHGLIHFAFCCYGAGYSEDDTDGPHTSNPRLRTPSCEISRLPQALLSNCNGAALACLGHVNKAWATSFLNKKKRSQPDNFRDVLARICRGDRLGNATDLFNQRWSVLSAELLNKLKQQDEQGARFSATDIARLRIARNDARDYIVLGDPAVRLNVEEMPILAGRNEIP